MMSIPKATIITTTFYKDSEEGILDRELNNYLLKYNDI